MAETDKDDEVRKQLVSLIRRIARDEAYEVIDEHLEDYEHNERKADLSGIKD